MMKRSMTVAHVILHYHWRTEQQVVPFLAGSLGRIVQVDNSSSRTGRIVDVGLPSVPDFHVKLAGMWRLVETSHWLLRLSGWRKMPSTDHRLLKVAEVEQH